MVPRTWTAVAITTPLVVLLFCCFATTSVAALAAPLEAGWAGYKALLIERPILTKAVTSALIMSLSDGVTQQFERSKLGQEKVVGRVSADGSSSTYPPPAQNWRRTWETAMTGFFWSGPVSHSWYQILEQIVALLRVPTGQPVVGLISRILLDALIFSPVTIAGYFAVVTLFQGGNVQDIKKKLQGRWRKTVVAAWSFWPAVNVVNFGLVPLPFRVLYSNIMAFLWTGYLSFVNNQKRKKSLQSRRQE